MLPVQKTPREEAGFEVRERSGKATRGYGVAPVKGKSDCDLILVGSLFLCYIKIFISRHYF